MADKIFAKGIIYKEPSDKAPDFVIGGLSIKKSEFMPFLEEQDGDWVNLKINLGKNGKPYLELDLWKPKVANDIPSVAPSTKDDLPF